MGMMMDMYGGGGGGGGGPPHEHGGMGGGGGGYYGSGGPHGGVGSFGASPDIDYGMGVYEQRIRTNSFQQANDHRLRAGSFGMYPPQQHQAMYQNQVPLTFNCLYRHMACYLCRPSYIYLEFECFWLRPVLLRCL